MTGYTVSRDSDNCAGFTNGPKEGSADTVEATPMRIADIMQASNVMGSLFATGDALVALR